MAHLDLKNLNAILWNEERLQSRGLRRITCGHVTLASGQVVACDPLVNVERPAFSRRVLTAGKYKVEILCGSANAVAVLWLVEVVDRPKELRWELALLDGQDAATLGAEDFFGYPVDAGVGCFADAEVLAAIEVLNTKDDAFANEVMNGLEDKNFIEIFPLTDNKQSSLVVFSTAGDGMFPSYWGLDKNNQVMVLLTDFMTIEGGDARHKWQREADDYLASLTEEKQLALENFASAISQGKLDVVGKMLAEGLVQSTERIPSLGSSGIFEAIRLNNSEMLRVLLAGQPVPKMPEFEQHNNVKTYLQYARCLKKVPNPEIFVLLESDSQTEPFA